MKPEVEEPVHGTEHDVLLLGRSSWKPEDRSLKYAWPDKNGRRARGGEVPVSAIPQAVLLAARTGYLTREQIAVIVRGLVDVLVRQ